MTQARVKNWATFQHYKDRSPPWIKLHRGLLDDFNFSSLPLASKALAPLMWLLAAETADGLVSTDPEFLAFRLRWKLTDVKAGLSPLIERGFLVSASALLAPCLRAATPETETEEAEKEKALSGKPLRFADFWKAYPNKKGRLAAEKTWRSRKFDAKASEIIADVEARKKSDPDWQRGAIPHGSTYVNEERWQDALKADPLPIISTATAGNSPRLDPETEARRKADALAEQQRQFKELGYAP